MDDAAGSAQRAHTNHLSAPEESFRMLVQSAKDFAIFMLDPEGRVASWNVGAERIKGYAASEIIGLHFSRFYTKADAAAGKPQRQLDEAARQGRIELEGWRVRKDGSRFWASVVITALFDERGVLRGFAKVTRDVTERRRLAFLGEASAVLSASLDYEATLPSFAKLSVPFMADWTSVQLLEGERLRTVALAHAGSGEVGLGWALERTEPADRRGASGPWHVIDTGQAELIPEITDELLRATTKDAQHHRMARELGLRSAIIVPLLAPGAALGAITFASAEGRRYDAAMLRLAQEIAGRAALAVENARAHQELGKERAWLRQVVDQMPAGVVIAEAPSGRIVLSNTAAERTAGAAIGAYAGMSARLRRVMKAGRLLEPAEIPLARALHGERVVDEELTLELDGRDVVLSVSAAPVREREGGVIAAVTILQDVTERKRAQIATEQEALFRERFIGILGHDLRNPLSAIVNTAHLLLRRNLADADRRAVTRIATSGDRMSRMISDVLDLTRARLGGGIAMAPRAGSLREVCQQVVDELRVAYPHSALRFEAEGQGWGEWDADRVAQALSNLIGNAVQHGREGTPVEVRLAEGGAGVELCVRNEGEPIPRELLPHLFDPFRRGGAQPGRRSGGLGLGLYIAREIVAAHHGSIDVRSDEKGTTFVVVLPRRATRP